MNSHLHCSLWKTILGFQLKISPTWPIFFNAMPCNAITRHKMAANPSLIGNKSLLTWNYVEVIDLY